MTFQSLKIMTSSNSENFNDANFNDANFNDANTSSIIYHWKWFFVQNNFFAYSFSWKSSQ